MRILLLNLQGLGNAIISYPLIKALSKKYDVSLLAMIQNGSHEFYKTMLPKINNIGVTSFSDVKSWNSGSYDFAITLYPAWKRENYVLFFMNAKNKYNFLLKNKPYTWPFFKHLYPENGLTDFDINIKSIKKILDFNLTSDDFILNKVAKRRQIVIHPTASSIFKYYSADLFAGFINHYYKEYEIKLISGKQEVEIKFCEEIMRKINSGVSYLPGPSFNDLSNILSESEFFIGLDSAITHMAALCGCKIFCLWSFADYKRVAPYSQKTVIFLSEKSLSLGKEKSGNYVDCRNISNELKIETLIAAFDGQLAGLVESKFLFREGSYSLCYY